MFVASHVHVILHFWQDIYSVSLAGMLRVIRVCIYNLVNMLFVFTNKPFSPDALLYVVVDICLCIGLWWRFGVAVTRWS